MGRTHPDNVFWVCCCCGCLPIAGLVAGALCSVLVIPTLLLGWTGLAIAHFPRNLFYAYYGVFGTKLCVRWLAGWAPGFVSRAPHRLTRRCASLWCPRRALRRVGCNLKLLLMLTVWLPLLLLPVCSAIAAVLVGVVFGLVAPIGLIFSDDWTPWAHVTTTCHMVVDYNRWLGRFPRFIGRDVVPYDGKTYDINILQIVVCMVLGVGSMLVLGLSVLVLAVLKIVPAILKGYYYIITGYADLLHGSAGGVWFCMAFPLFIVAVACWPVVALLGAALAIVGGFMVGFFVGFAPVQKGYWGAYFETLFGLIRDADEWGNSLVFNSSSPCLCACLPKHCHRGHCCITSWAAPPVQARRNYDIDDVERGPPPVGIARAVSGDSDIMTMRPTEPTAPRPTAPRVVNNGKPAVEQWATQYFGAITVTDVWDSLFTAMKVHAEELIEAGALPPYKNDLDDVARYHYRQGLTGLTILRCLLRSVDNNSRGLLLMGTAGELTEESRPKNRLGNTFWAPSIAAKHKLRDLAPTGAEVAWLGYYVLYNGDDARIPNNIEAPQPDRRAQLANLAGIVARMANKATLLPQFDRRFDGVAESLRLNPHGGTQWVCGRCTFQNVGGTVCSMCESARE